MADIQVAKLESEGRVENTLNSATHTLSLPENVESLNFELEKIKMQKQIPVPPSKKDEPELFVVHDVKSVYYYTNQEYAKKQLFDVSMNYYNKEDNSEAEREEFEEEAPYLEAFKKGKWANLQMVYKLSLDIENLFKLSSKEKCDLVNRIGTVENKKFDA